MNREHVQKETVRLIEETGAMRAGHFVYHSWRHGDSYFDKAALYVDSHRISRVCRMMAQLVVVEWPDTIIDAVLSPALGGVLLSQWVGYHLQSLTGNPVVSLFAEKVENPVPIPYLHTDKFRLGRGYGQAIKGRKVLVVEDTLTTGASAETMVGLTRAYEAEVVGLAAIWNRGGVTPEKIGNPPRMLSLVELELPSYPDSECPLCEKNIPIDMKFGSGKKFLDLTKR